MRVAIFAVGTRGDAEPAFALAYALRQRGHDVVVGVAEDLVELGTSVGVDARRLSVNAKEFLQSEEGQRWLAAGNSKQYIAGLAKKRHEIADAVHTDMISMVSGADLIMSTRLLEGEAVSLAEWLKVPFAGLHYVPLRGNRAHASPWVTTRSLPGPVNALTHVMFQRAEWRSIRPDVNHLREKLDLPPMAEPVARRAARAGALELQGYSRFVLPELALWDRRRPLAGYLRLAREQRDLLGNEEPDPALTRWLDRGDPPVYFGFGSAPVQDVSATVDMIRTASAAMGVRALVTAGWSDIPAAAADDDRLFIVPAVNHDQILPRCRAAVHHGGAGTTAASLGAGTPTVVCSVNSEQPFWGKAVERLGVGNTFRFVDLGAERLIASISPLLSDEARSRSAKLAADLRTEDGPGYAAKLIDEIK